MTTDHRTYLARKLGQIIVTSLGGPCGDPDEHHVSAATKCYEIIDELLLGPEMFLTQNDYLEIRKDFEKDANLNDPEREH